MLNWVGLSFLPYLPFPINKPLISSESLQSHWTARAKLLRAYAYLCSKSKLTAISEACGSIPIYASRINLLLEQAGVALRVGDDSLAVS